MKRILKQLFFNSSSVSLSSSLSEVVVLVGGFCRTVTPPVAAARVSSAFTRSSSRGKKSIATSTASSISLDGNDDETANTASGA